MREKTKVRKRAEGRWDLYVTVAVWACLGAVVATALAHAVVCRRRQLYNNQISTIASGAFAGLTALTLLYAAGL